MNTEELADLLRERFRSGVSVAELVHTAKEHSAPDLSNRELSKIVRDAFHLTLGGWYLLSSTESFGTGEVPDSNLTWVFLREILLLRDKWDSPANGTPRWYDGLEKTESKDRHASAEEYRCGLTQEGWDALSQKDRDHIRMIEATRLGLSEDVQIIAALAERLQQKVNELNLLEHQPV
jgi:hypothetical protein